MAQFLLARKLLVKFAQHNRFIDTKLDPLLFQKPKGTEKLIGNRNRQFSSKKEDIKTNGKSFINLEDLYSFTYQESEFSAIEK